MDTQFTPKGLLWAFGLLLLAVGGQPLVTYLSGDSSLKTILPSLAVVIAGVMCIALALFWKPKEGSRGASLFERLGRWGASPIPYALAVFLMWVYFETIAVQHNIELATLRNDEQSIAKVIDRLVLPRRLTPLQQKTISQYLLQFEPHEYSFRVASGSREADEYRSDIEQALTHGGWTIATNDSIVSATDVPEGIEIQFTQTVEHAQHKNDPRNPNALLLLQEAFGLGGIRISGGSQGGGPNVTEDRLIIEIGSAGKDSFAFTAPDF